MAGTRHHHRRSPCAEHRTPRTLDAPELRFSATIDDEDWRVTYAPQSGRLRYRRHDDHTVPLKGLLTRLHTRHTYPDRLGATWLHALIVDFTAGCLLLWCLSGSIMWWQLRRLRRLGILAIVGGSVAAMVVLAGIVPGLG